jgi:uncharacterized protein
MRMRTTIPLAIAASGAATLGYASLIERNWFALRQFEIPVLPPGTGPLRILHISDTHLTPNRKHLISWVRSLNELDPHLVVNTGDSIAHPEAVEALMQALGPLLSRPGAFVLGSNDLYAPEARNPLKYLWAPSSRWPKRKRTPNLPTEKLRGELTSAGWLDLNNHRGQITTGGIDIALAGVDDAHINKDRYSEVAGRASQSAGLRLGVMHTPEPRVMDWFVADGYDLLLAGHTHGGQICLPFYGALVTNCGIDQERVKGLHHHPADGPTWLHVSAGLGTSPTAPARFACRPEASLLTLVPRDGQ